MQLIRIILNVFLVVAVLLQVYLNHHLDRINEDLAGEVYRLTNQQSDCAVQLRACYMDVEAMEQMNEAGK